MRSPASSRRVPDSAGQHGRYATAAALRARADGSGGTMREWVAGDTHDPALVRPYAPDTVNAQAYADMRAFRAPIVETHELTYFILLALIAIHIASAVIAELREGGTIISAMFTGRKIHRCEPVDATEATRTKRNP
jgi:hypothetical protein